MPWMTGAEGRHSNLFRVFCLPERSRANPSERTPTNEPSFQPMCDEWEPLNTKSIMSPVRDLAADWWRWIQPRGGLGSGGRRTGSGVSSCSQRASWYYFRWRGGGACYHLTTLSTGSSGWLAGKMVRDGGRGGGRSSNVPRSCVKPAVIVVFINDNSSEFHSFSYSRSFSEIIF